MSEHYFTHLYYHYDEETEEEAEFEIGINFDYSPEEKQTYDHPGCAAEIGVFKVDNKLRPDIELDDDQLEKAVWSHIEEADNQQEPDEYYAPRLRR